MDKERSKINCPIFQKQEPIIKELANNINKAKGIEEKARVSEELKKEIGVLLSCSDYDEKRLDCSSCRFIANLRKRAVDLIIKAKKLSEA